MKLNNKAIRIAQVTQDRWPSLISKAVLRYNQTPHTSTKFAPDFFAGKNLQYGILPQITKKAKANNEDYKLALANDAHYKQAMKMYTDNKNHAKEHSFKIGDPVLHKWDRSSKYMPLFDPIPYIITRVKHSMITAQNVTRTITRNSSHFKVISWECYKQANASNKATKQSRKYVYLPAKLTPAQTTSSTLPPTPQSHPRPPSTSQQQTRPPIQQRQQTPTATTSSTNTSIQTERPTPAITIAPTNEARPRQQMRTTRNQNAK
jgi:hypothetical protein